MASLVYRLLAINLITVPVCAAPNTTDNNLVYGWVSTNCRRGTSDILWSCLSKIFLCVWTVIHLPITYYQVEKPQSMKAKLLRSKLLPARFRVVVPECLTNQALIELLKARRTVRHLKLLSTTRKSTLTHRFAVNMGAFCLKSPEGKYRQLEARHVALLYDLIGKEKGGLELHQPLLHFEEWVAELEATSDDRIDDEAKSDVATKVLTGCQTLWLTTQILFRLIQHKVLTLLEVTSMGYVACAIIAYAAWWCKPQDNSVPVMIRCSDAAVDELSSSPCLPFITKWREYAYVSLGWAHQDWGDGAWAAVCGEDYRPNCEAAGTSDRAAYLLGILILSSSIFGAIHVASWGVTLPSATELWDMAMQYAGLLDSSRSQLSVCNSLRTVVLY